MNRISWNEYFLSLAKLVSTRSTCPRAFVGAVIVKDKRIIATGYNGAPAGQLHCQDIGCDIVDNHCVRAIHAETNAIAQAARFGISIEGATLYYWDSQGRPPSVCVKCSQLIVASGISIIVTESGEYLSLEVKYGNQKRNDIDDKRLS